MFLSLNPEIVDYMDSYGTGSSTVCLPRPASIALHAGPVLGYLGMVPVFEYLTVRSRYVEITARKEPTARPRKVTKRDHTPHTCFSVIIVKQGLRPVPPHLGEINHQISGENSVLT